MCRTINKVALAPHENLLSALLIDSGSLETDTKFYYFGKRD